MDFGSLNELFSDKIAGGASYYFHENCTHDLMAMYCAPLPTELEGCSVILENLKF